MRPIKPWLRILMIVDAIVFVLGLAGIAFYGSTDGDRWPIVGLFAAATITVMVFIILYWWQTRGPQT